MRGVIPTLLLAACGPAFPLDDVLRADHIQVVGTHNSYHVMTADIEPWRYTHAPLDEQIAEQGVRQFELDAWWDADLGVWEVLHVPGLDAGTTCQTLPACFEAQALGSAQTPDHVPLVTLIELKSDVEDVGDARAQLDAIGQQILQAWPDGAVITPAEVQGDAPTLAAAVESRGWPTLGQTRGRALYVLHAGDGWRAVLTDDDTTVGSTPLFAEAGGDLSCTACAVQTINDPHSSDLAPALDAGQWVRTRTDADTAEARANDTSRRDAARASGAHALSTDFPVPHPDTGYVVSLDQGRPAVCNPVTAPPECTNDAVSAAPR